MITHQKKIMLVQISGMVRFSFGVGVKSLKVILLKSTDKQELFLYFR